MQQTLAIQEVPRRRQPPAHFAERYAAVLQQYGLPAVESPRPEADAQLAAAIGTLRERVAAAGAPK